MSTLREIRVLAEGYDDRAFWAGWLSHHHGLVDARTVPADVWVSLGLKPNFALKGASRSKGQFVYLDPGRTRVVRVIPVQEQDGDNKLSGSIDDALRLRATAEVPLAAIVVNEDDDTLAGAPCARTPAGVCARLRNLDLDIEPCALGGRLDDGCRVVQFTWRCDDPPDPRLPAKQTLERLACAALADAHPERVESARAWLAARPGPLGADHKATAGALWAGWSADDGWSDFYKALWRDPGVRDALLSRLASLDAVLADLLGRTPG